MRARSQCPFLPEPLPEMSYRDLSALRGGDPALFYLTALRYGQHLWLAGHTGRAVLALTRALYADLPASAAILQKWPLPYRALAWFIARHPNEDFPGNPRVSFQHQATRLRGARMQLRRARAWAVWAIVRAAKPGLAGDAAQPIREPGLSEIEAGLQRFGHENETTVWRTALAE